jgi:hypothetical protein
VRFQTYRAELPWGQSAAFCHLGQMQLSYGRGVHFPEIKMADTSQIKEHMDVISSDRKTVGKVDHLDGPDKIKLTKQSSPNGEHHHFIPVLASITSISMCT